MSEPTDTTAPWTIKSCPTATREAVIVAARKEGLTVGQWLERRVREWTEDGGPTRVETGSADTSGALERLVGLAVTLSAVPTEQRNDSLIREARRRVREGLTALRRGSPPTLPPRLAGPVSE